MMNCICRFSVRDRWLAVGFAALVMLGGTVAVGDELVLTNGRKYQGLMLEKTDGYVRFRVLLSTSTAELTFPTDRVKDLIIDGKMPQPATPKPAAPKPTPTEVARTPGPPAEPRPMPTRGDRSKTTADIRSEIARAGKTPPDWWDSVALKVPRTMDLDGTRKLKGWHPNVKIGAHWYSIINPNPGRWKSGTKLVQHVTEYRIKNNSRMTNEAAGTLARSYLRLLKDHARAAYWYEFVMKGGGRQHAGNISNLAECYFHLGSKPMAMALLRRYGLDRNGTPVSIKLWAAMGDVNRALSTAKAAARGRGAGMALVAAGDVSRKAGDLERAAAFYEQAEGKFQPKAKKWRALAASAATAMRIASRLDLAKIPDGAYTGSGMGFRGNVEVKVVVKAGRIESVTVTKHREDGPFTSITDVPKSIVEKQGFKGIDTVSGATCTNEAIIRGAAAALEKGMKK